MDIFGNEKPGYIEKQEAWIYFEMRSLDTFGNKKPG